MSSYTELFKNHRVWQLLKDIDPLIYNALNREGIDFDTLESISRIKSILAFTNKQLTSADPYLAQMASLENLSVSLQNVTQEVNSFVIDGNPEHITSANMHADSVLSNIAQINVPTTTKDFSAAKEAAESYRYGIKKALSDVKSRSSQIDGELTSLKTHLDDTLPQINSELTSLKTQLDEISSGIAAERERLSGIITDFQSQFAATQESRNNEFTANQKEQQDNFNKIISDYTQKLEEQNTSFSAQHDDIAKLHKEELENLKKQFVDNSTKLHNEIIERKKEVEKLVGVIGNLGVTSGYLKTANDAKSTVRIWQIVTVGAILGLIEIACFAFLPSLTGEFHWSGFAGRVFVSFTFGILAAYAASQADKYQKVERHNRRLALELEAIGPFIASIATRQTRRIPSYNWR